MGRRPLRYKVWNAGRYILVLMTVLALFVAPFVVNLTHGPAVAMTVDKIDEIAAHGHAQQHGHTHDETGRGHPGGPLGGHNPADHEHQLHALVCQTANALHPLPDGTPCRFSEAFQHLTPDGPKRPPRVV